MLKLILGSFAVVLACLILATGAGEVHAQAKTGGGGGGGAGGGGAGGGGAGGGGAGGGGSAFGGSASSNTFGGAGGTSSQGGGNTSSAAYGSGSSILGPNYYNVLGYGLGGNKSQSSSSAGNSSSGGSVSSLASLANGGTTSSSTTTNSFQNSQATSTVKFGKALYNVSPVSTFTQPTSNSGTASIRSRTSNQQNNLNALRVSYVARVGFTPQRVPMAVMNTDFQSSVAQSPDLSKPNNRVQLVQDGEVTVLRGVVQDGRERALAEALARMTPGIRSVRNELAVRDNSSEGLASR